MFAIICLLSSHFISKKFQLFFNSATTSRVPFSILGISCASKVSARLYSFNSSKCSPIMPDEVREHLTRDQRPFLHPESLQIFRFTVSALQFTHSSSTGSGQRTPDMRSETITSSRITPDLHIHIFFSSVHSLIFYRVQVREHLTRDQRPFLHPESLQILKIHSFSSSVHLTHLLQGSDQRTPDTRSETIPSSRITPDLQIHSFFSSVHSLIFYRVQVRKHLTRDQTIPSSRITPDLQIHSFSTSVHLTHLLQGSDQRTPDKRSDTIPSSRITPDLQIHSFSTSVHLTHLLQGSGQRTPDTRSETFLHPESL